MRAVPDHREILAAVRRWAAANYPGCHLEYVTIHLSHLPAPIQFADSPAFASAEEEGRFSQCIADILDVLRQANRPLTTTRILDELSRAGKEWSERHVNSMLASMIRDGTLVNDPAARPRGYRLPEWDESTEGR